MDLENSIRDVIGKKLEDGTIEKLISEQLQNGINKALGELFGGYGDCTKMIQSQIKSVMVPYLENYDYGEYIVKLDSVLVDILKNTALDNKNILENFKELMTPISYKDTIKVTELFDKWCNHVAKNIETDGLEVFCEDSPSYALVEVTFEFEEDSNGRDWLKRETGKILFECEHDDNMNVCIEVYRYSDIHKKNQWRMDIVNNSDLKSLRHLDKFAVMLMSLNHSGVIIEMDQTSQDAEVELEAEPEASFS